MKHGQILSPKCILFITTGLGTGGAEAMLVRVISHLRDVGHNIVVVNLTTLRDQQGSLEKISVVVYNAPFSKPIVALSTLWNVRKQMKSNQTLAIIGWMYAGNLVAFFLRSYFSKKTRLIWSVRQSLDFWEGNKTTTKCMIWLNSKLSGLVDCVLFNSHLSSVQHQKFGFQGENHVVVANGFELPSYVKVAESRAKQRKQIGLNGSEILLGVVGRFHPVKGHRLLSEAWQLVKTEKPELTSSVYLCVVGDKVPEGWHDQDLFRDNVYLFDKHSDAISLMCAFDGLILPSYAEAFPNVVGEAMSVGLPVIASDVGDVKLILPPENFIFPRGDVFELKRKIEEFLALGVEERLIIGEQNRKIINNDYNIKNVTNAYKRAFGL